MIRRTALMCLLTLLIGFVGVNTAHARWAVPLINPGVSEWGCKLSMADVKKGIDSGLLVKQWSPSGSTTGYIQGKIVVRGKHTLVVDINYTSTTFDIKYKSSINLKHSIDSDG